MKNKLIVTCAIMMTAISAGLSLSFAKNQSAVIASVLCQKKNFSNRIQRFMLFFCFIICRFRRNGIPLHAKDESEGLESSSLFFSKPKKTLKRNDQ